MDESQSDNDIQTTIWYMVSVIAQEQANKLGKTASPDFVAALANVVQKQMETMALDLEWFARHAKRSTISMEDVKLCARRNDSLYTIVSDAAMEISRQNASAGPSRKKKK